MNDGLHSIALSFWLDKQSKDKYVRGRAWDNMRYRIHRQTLSFPKGRGNKAWKRVKIERAKLRAEGWWTLEELLGGRMV